MVVTVMLNMWLALDLELWAHPNQKAQCNVRPLMLFLLARGSELRSSAACRPLWLHSWQCCFHAAAVARPVNHGASNCRVHSTFRTAPHALRPPRCHSSSLHATPAWPTCRKNAAIPPLCWINPRYHTPAILPTGTPCACWPHGKRTRDLQPAPDAEAACWVMAYPSCWHAVHQQWRAVHQ